MPRAVYASQLQETPVWDYQFSNKIERILWTFYTQVSGKTSFKWTQELVLQNEKTENRGKIINSMPRNFCCRIFHKIQKVEYNIGRPSTGTLIEEIAGRNLEKTLEDRERWLRNTNLGFFSANQFLDTMNQMKKINTRNALPQMNRWGKMEEIGSTFSETQQPKSRTIIIIRTFWQNWPTSFRILRSKVVDYNINIPSVKTKKLFETFIEENYSVV